MAVDCCCAVGTGKEEGGEAVEDPAETAVCKLDAFEEAEENEPRSAAPLLEATKVSLSSENLTAFFGLFSVPAALLLALEPPLVTILLLLLLLLLLPLPLLLRASARKAFPPSVCSTSQSTMSSRDLTCRVRLSTF